MSKKAEVLAINQKKKLAITQDKKITKWEEKINTGEAFKEVKEIMSGSGFDCFPQNRLNQLVRTVIPKMIIKNEPLNEVEQKQWTDVIYDFGIDNGLSIFGATEERHRGMIINFREELIKEYDCKTNVEKALVDLTAMAYSRTLSITRMLVLNATNGHTTPNLNTFISVMSKELDRANRHFLTALEVLKQMKQPELMLSVKANTAFISQNQQFNNKTPSNNNEC